jgi:hypothetical protein
MRHKPTGYTAFTDAMRLRAYTLHAQHLAVYLSYPAHSHWANQAWKQVEYLHKIMRYLETRPHRPINLPQL